MRHLAVISRAAALLAAVIAADVFTAAAPNRTAAEALPFALAWAREYPGTPPVTVAVSDGGWLVAGYADRLELLSLATGEPAGALPLPSPRLSCDAVSCLSADDATIRSIDLARRRVRWQRPAPGRLAFPPMQRSGWVFLTTADGQVVALRDTDGTHVWTFAAKGPLTGPPSVDGNRIAVATTNAQLSLLDVQTGRQLWTTTLVNGTPGAPRLGGGLVFVGTENRDLLFINAANGKVQETQRTGAAIIGAPAIDDHLIYTGGQDGVLRAFNRGNHALKWYADLPTRPASGGPLATAGLTIVALRTGAFQVFLGDGDGKQPAAALPPPGAGDNTVLLPMPPMIAGTGRTTRLITVSVGAGDSSKWLATVFAGAAALPLSGLPAEIPGLALTLTPPR